MTTVGSMGQCMKVVHMALLTMSSLLVANRVLNVPTTASSMDLSKIIPDASLFRFTFITGFFKRIRQRAANKLRITNVNI